MTSLRTLALLALLTTAPLAALADPIVAGAVSSSPLGSSADSFSFNPLSTAGAPTMTQTGTFVVGDSGWLTADFDFTFIDNITLNGVTQAVSISGDDNITAAADTLSIYASGPIRIGNSIWSLQPFQLAANNIQSYNIALTSNITSVTPEPAGLLLLGTGALVTAFAVRRRLYAI